MSTTETAIDIAHDLNMSNDDEWNAANGDYDAENAIVAAWEARLTAAAERLGVTVTFLGIGTPEAYEWDKAHGSTDEDAEAVCNLAAKVWDEAL